MRIETIQIQIEKNGAFKKTDHTAELTAYLQDSGEECRIQKRPAVVICPGGGYEFCSFREGEPVAFQFLAEGCQAAVLRYSVLPARYPTALMQAARAMVLLREHAEEWNIDPDKIIVQGFSAGGHLAASLGIFWNRPFLGERLGVEAERIRPDGMILCYPVISSGEYCHGDSFVNLLGESYDALVDEMSLEKQVHSQVPPAFIWHTFSDDCVPVENSLLFVMALRKQGIPTEFHMYPRGVHGLSLANSLTLSIQGHGIQEECQSWMALAKVWLKNL